MRKPKVVPLPDSYHDRWHRLGLSCPLYLPQSHARMTHSRGVAQLESLPQLLVSPDGAAILWLDVGATGNAYSIAGWQPMHRHRFGGLSDNLHNALSWLERSYAIDRNEAKDFLGC